MTPLFDRHRAMLDRTLHARRGGPSPTPERVAPTIPSAADVTQLAGRRFAADGTPPTRWVADARSPYGLSLDIRYAAYPPAAHLAAATGAQEIWQVASVSARTGVALEILARLETAAATLAQALVHATGEPPAVAALHSVPLACRRGLAAAAEAYEAMRTGRAGATVGARPVSLLGPVREPLGAVLPELVAAMVTGRVVLLCPQPRAVLPLALVAETARTVLAGAGFSPDVVRLWVGDDALKRSAPDLCVLHATQAVAGANPVIVDRPEDLASFCRHVADALLFCGGQHRARPQNVFIPADGVRTNAGQYTLRDITGALAATVDSLVADRRHGIERRGAVQNPQTVAGVLASRSLGRVLREPGAAPIEGFPQARTLSPLLVRTDRETVYAAARSGPLAFVIAAADTAESIERAAHGAATTGAAEATIFSTDDRVLEAAADAFAGTGTVLACNPLAADAGRWPEGYGDDGLRAIDESFVARHLDLLPP